MKTTFAGILFLLYFSTGITGQVANPQFEMPVYFEDAVGNKDTLIIGYNGDKETTFLYDPLFDGPPILEPMDSVFEIRAFHSDNYVHVNQYLLKKVIVSYDNFPFDSCGVSEGVYLIISCKYPPVTVRYDSTVLGATTCRSNALLAKDEQIFLLQYWWDATNYFCMGSQSEINLEDINVPGEYLYVEDVEVEGQGKRDLPGVLIVFHEWGACTDSTLLKISEAFQSKKMEVRIAPNPSAGNLNISVNSVIACSNTSIQLIDLLGKTVASKSVSLEQGSNTIAWDVQHLPKGFYWLKFIADNGNSSVPVILQE